MTTHRITLFTVVAAAFAFLVAPAARAASLQQVSNWEAGGTFPSDVSMYVYVPDKVVANPPILTLVHYCGGTASAVFGQAQGGGIVSAADQYGFIMVVPSSGRCWDVVSDKARTRDGGGDSHAIKQMVKYALGKYQANADRVYSTGDSSGGMMTELLLAVYPDVFKAGAAFAGMPAACRGANEPGNGSGYSGACAGGNVTHTAQEWGDIARMLDPGYTGHRPRVQLFHGDADMTINYKNFTEAIKEWTNVLGVEATPTSTTNGVTLGTHQATRQSWKNACGYVVLDAFTSIGGDHGPSDALFKAQYVIPFLGLDKAGPIDPEVQQCNSAGTGGGAGAGGQAAGGAGNAGTGGVAGSAGNVAVGGAQQAGGTNAAGGGTGGSTTAGASGTLGVGGHATTGGNPGSGGTSNNIAAAGGSNDAGAGANGCSFTLGKARSNQPLGVAVLALGLALATAARSRRRTRRSRAND
jgi:acetylxylan esterase